MSMYFGISGNAVKVKSLYIGTNNIAKAIKSVYIGINGKARPVWPQYTWSRYTLVSTPTYTISDAVSGKILFTEAQSITVYNRCGWLPAQGIFTVSGPQYTLRWSSFSGDLVRFPYYLPNNKTLWTLTSSYKIDNQNWAAVGTYQTIMTAYVSKKGSYIDTVTSLNGTSYPDDGEQGGYWYVRQ